jgi:DNA-binding CsgD family transcriptional regulator
MDRDFATDTNEAYRLLDEEAGILSALRSKGGTPIAMPSAPTRGPTQEAPTRVSTIEDALPNHSAAFVCADPNRILEVNFAAGQIFDVRAQSPINDLPIEIYDLAALRDSIRAIVSGRCRIPKLLRARSSRTGGPIVLRVRPLRDGATVHALVVTSELAWPDALSVALKEAFDLTVAEIEIVRALCEGAQVKDIARDRGRSIETVRTQLRSILSKTDTHSQSELVRITLCMIDLAGNGCALARREEPADHPGMRGARILSSVLRT